MRAVEWTQQQPTQAAAVFGLVVGAIVGFTWPIGVPATEQSRGDAWQRPAELANARGDEKEFGQLRDAPIWGDSALGVNGAAIDKKTMWRLTGIIADPSLAALVILEGAAEAKRVYAGGALPDGGVIKEISASSVVFERGGCVYERLLYGAVLPEENAPCNPGAQPAK